MGALGGEHGHDHHHHEQPMTREEVVRSLLVLAEVALGSGDYDSAADAYGSLLRLESNETALYNLGSFYARGLGVKRDFVEGARLFHQAELMGNEQAGKLCRKCMLDYVHEGLDGWTSAELYAQMAVFVSKALPEVAEQRLEVNRNLFAIAGNHFNKQEYDEAAKIFRAAAEFGNDGYAQNYLGVLYNAGAGVQENDLAALYWFDRAVDNGAADLALKDRDGIFDAYRQSLSSNELSAVMGLLAARCEAGTADIPKDSAKASRWHKVAECLEL